MVAHLVPGELGADHDPGAGADDDQGSLRGAQGAVDLADEILETRRVHQVDLVIVPGQMRDRGADGDLALGFLGLEIEGGVAGFRLSQPVDGAAGVEHRLGEASLAVVAMPE